MLKEDGPSPPRPKSLYANDQHIGWGQQKPVRSSKWKKKSSSSSGRDFKSQRPTGVRARPDSLTHRLFFTFLHLLFFFTSSSSPPFFLPLYVEPQFATLYINTHTHTHTHTCVYSSSYQDHLGSCCLCLLFAFPFKLLAINGVPNPLALSLSLSVSLSLSNSYCIFLFLGGFSRNVSSG